MPTGWSWGWEAELAGFDESALDPDLVARLRERFGDPPAPQRSRELEEREELRRTRERAAAAVDPGLLAQLRAHEQRAARHRKEPPRMSADPGIAGLDLTVWSLSEIGAPEWYERPHEVRKALEESVPQALLRDLHRPVRHFGEVALRPIRPPLDPTGERGRALVRRLMAARYRASPSAQARASELAAEGLAELRALLAEPWDRALPQEPRAVPRKTPGTEDAAWFGIEGGYDPDQ